MKIFVATVALAAAVLAGGGVALANETKGGGSIAATQINRMTLRLASDPGQVANVRGASTDNGAQIIQWPLSNTTNELWEPESTLDGHYRFKAVNSGLCLNVRGGGTEDGAQIIQYTCGSAANELWRFVQKGIGYQIVSKSSGKCLNVRGGVGQGNELIQYTCTADGAANDVWLPVWEPTR